MYDKAYKTWQNPHHMPYHPRPISSFGPKGHRNDTKYDTDFAMYYSLYIGSCVMSSNETTLHPSHNS